MEKPSRYLLELYELGRITGIHVEQRQISIDESDTHVDLTGRDGCTFGWWKHYRPFLEVEVDYNSVAHINRRDIEKVRVWKEFEKANTEELAEYQRLKKKFG
jgi:hypothetical protein